MRHRFTKHVLFEVATKLNKADSLKYSEILASDQYIRDFGPSQLFEQAVAAAIRVGGNGENERGKTHMLLLKIMKDISEFCNY